MDDRFISSDFLSRRIDGLTPETVAKAAGVEVGHVYNLLQKEKEDYALLNLMHADSILIERFEQNGQLPVFDHNLAMLQNAITLAGLVLERLTDEDFELLEKVDKLDPDRWNAIGPAVEQSLAGSDPELIISFSTFSAIITWICRHSSHILSTLDEDHPFYAHFLQNLNDFDYIEQICAYIVVMEFLEFYEQQGDIGFSVN